MPAPVYAVAVPRPVPPLQRPTHRLYTWSAPGAEPETLDLTLVGGQYRGPGGVLALIGADGHDYWIDGAPPARWEIVDLGNVSRHAALYALGKHRPYADAARRYGVTVEAVSQAAERLGRAPGKPGRPARAGVAATHEIRVRFPSSSSRGRERAVTVRLTDEERGVLTDAAGDTDLATWMRERSGSPDGGSDEIRRRCLEAARSKFSRTNEDLRETSARTSKTT